ncbi:mitochondrial 54S ribosomal protein mrpl1 [Xylographa trunciseda]|nr:mitochondrial 54S ribosomal protein mrpl1 [Xylographa trunciseda]
MAAKSIIGSFSSHGAAQPGIPCLYRSQVLPFLAPLTTIRRASGLSKSSKTSKAREAPTKKKKARTDFKRDDIKNAMQFSLCDAMRYIRAFEVGRQPTSSKYELHVSLKSLKNGPVVRNRLRLTNPVDTSQRICVICPPDSPIAAAAIKAGASLVGEDTVFDAVKEGRIEFERCICHSDSLQKLSKANLGRILGPRGLMPSAKTGTVVKDVANSVRNMIGGSEYRERLGVVRMAVGQLGFTPEQMQQNIKEFMGGLKRDMSLLSDKITKEIHEVVLSSTNSPGFTLNGDFKSPTSVSTRELATF